MERINLSDNHRRSLSSAIYLVEKITVEIENELCNPIDLVMTKIASDKTDAELERIQTVLVEIKAYIEYMAIKYNLKSKNLDLNNVLRAQKSKMWEILCDSTSKGLRGYGKFPDEFAAEFDKDIDDLQDLIKKI
jgi:hypothetical protein